MSDKTAFINEWVFSDTPRKGVADPRTSAANSGGRLGSADALHLEAAPPPALVPFADMDYWYLTRDMAWTLPDSPTVINVPAGFTTDFATIPSAFWIWMPRTGRYGLPALVHDWLYWDQRTSRERSDQIFSIALQEVDVSPFRRSAMHRAVRCFGEKYWRENTAAKAKGEGRVLKKFPDDSRITWDDWRKRPGIFG